MILTISKWGNSQGIRLPKELLKKLHATIGKTVNAEYENGKVIIQPVLIPKSYDIHNLVNSIDQSSIEEEIDWGKPEGNELW